MSAPWHRMLLPKLQGQGCEHLTLQGGSEEDMLLRGIMVSEGGRDFLESTTGFGA